MSNDQESSWTSSWLFKIFCSNCGGIVELTKTMSCPLCNYSYTTDNDKISDIDFQNEELTMSFAGAIPWTTYLLLKMMQEEWTRPVNQMIYDNKIFKTSPRAMIVLLFWMQFENLMDQLLSDGMKRIPKKISDHLLKRHQQIGSRIDILYPLVFDSTFKEDLEKIGYSHLFRFLKNVQEKRNSFIHGNPEIIDDTLVKETVDNLQDVQIAWIKLYNFKIAVNNNARI